MARQALKVVPTVSKAHRQVPLHAQLMPLVPS